MTLTALFNVPRRFFAPTWLTAPAVVLAMLGLALPQLRGADFSTGQARPQRLPAVATPVSTAMPASAASLPSRAPAAISDVALDDSGVLRGQVVDSAGNPLSGVGITLTQQERLIGTARSDQNGRFALAGIAGGIYQIDGAAGEAVCRVWAPHTAPPAAQPAALLVAGQQLVRAQGPGSGVRRFFTSPWVLAGMLGAAIIVPIALNNRDKIPTS